MRIGSLSLRYDPRTIRANPDRADAGGFSRVDMDCAMKPKKPDPYPRDMTQHLAILKRYAEFATHRFACAVHRWAAKELAK